MDSDSPLSCVLCGEESDQPGRWCTRCVGEQGPPSVRTVSAELHLAPARLGPMRLLAAPISLLLLAVTALAGMRVSGLVVDARAALDRHAPVPARMAGVQQHLILAGVGLVAVIGVLWLTWWAVAYANLRPLGVDPHSRPLWAVVAWLVPFAAFVVPQRVADELWKGSDPWAPLGWRVTRHARRAGVVRVWWASSCAAVAVLAGAEIAHLTMAPARAVTAGVDAALIASAVLTAIAGMAAITLVTGVTARQGDKTRLMLEAGLIATP